MASSDSTCWGMLDAAADGCPESRSKFAERYEPMVRAYFLARWRKSPLVNDVDDAVQEAFLECLRVGGGLDRVRSDQPGGFRAFLYGLTRNVSRRFEERLSLRGPAAEIDPDAIQAREDTLSRVFDRAWARTVMREAGERQAERAANDGADALRRIDLLRLRFQDGLPIREIAGRWYVDPASVHREYARARDEFRHALRDVLASRHAIGGEALDRECSELLAMLA